MNYSVCKDNKKESIFVILIKFFLMKCSLQFLPVLKTHQQCKVIEGILRWMLITLQDIPSLAEIYS